MHKAVGAWVVLALLELACAAQPMPERVTVRGGAFDKETGQALAGVAAMLRLLDDKGAPTPNTLPVAGMSGTPTGADGRFVIYAVPEGTYYFSLTAEGYQAFGQKLCVRPDQPPEVEAKLDRLRFLRLRLRSPTGGPVAKAAVHAAASFLAGPKAGVLPVRRLSTDADGLCLLPPAPEQTTSWRLLVRVPGVGCAYVEPEVAAIEAGRLEVQLQPSGTIAGTVVDQTTGRAESRVALHLRVVGKLAEKPALSLTPPIATNTDERGRFSFADVPIGTWTLASDDPRVMQVDAAPVEVKSAGQAVTAVTVKLVTAARVSGQVLGVAGKPLASLRELPVTVWMRSAAGTCTSATQTVSIGADGRFEVIARTLGGVALSVWIRDEGWAVSPWLDRVAGSERRVELRLQPLRELMCHVSDAASGQAVTSAQVKIVPAAATTTATAAVLAEAYTDSAGTVRVRNLAPGDYTIRVSAFGYGSSAPLSLQIAAERDPADVRLTLKRPATP